MPVRRNYLDVYTDVRRRIVNNTPVNNFNPTGITKGLADSLATEIEIFNNNLEYVYRAIDPTRTAGIDLDNVGFLVGEQRSSAVTAADYTTTNFYFSIDQNLGWSVRHLIDRNYDLSEKRVLEEAGYITIDNGDVTELIIPEGTVVGNSDFGVSYVTIERVVINTQDTNFYTPIIATAPGPTYNVSSNVLIRHDLLQIAELRKIAQFIRCSNRFPIQNGKYSMNDEEYRYFISTSRSAIKTNEIAIRRSALQVPGIRDVLFEKNKFGNGTFSLVVDGVSPIVSNGLANAVEQRITQEMAYGAVAFVDKPEYLGVEINFTLILEPGVNDPFSIRNQARDSIISYINNLPIGAEIIWNQIVSSVVDLEGVNDFIANYFQYGKYDSFNKINKNKVVLRFVNQRAKYNQKWYTDSGLVSSCFA